MKKLILIIMLAATGLMAKPNNFNLYKEIGFDFSYSYEDAKKIFTDAGYEVEETKDLNAYDQPIITALIKDLRINAFKDVVRKVSLVGRNDSLVKISVFLDVTSENSEHVLSIFKLSDNCWFDKVATKGFDYTVKGAYNNMFVVGYISFDDNLYSIFEFFAIPKNERKK